MTTTQVSTPVHPFTSRADAVAASFRVFNLNPSAYGDMATAESAIQDKLDELDAKVAGPSAEDLATAGTSYGAGKGLAKVTAALAAPVLDERYSAIRKAAEAELARRADRPEWSTTALVESVAAEVPAVLSAICDAAQDALEGLPAAGRKSLLGRRVRATQITTEVANVQHDSAEDLAAYQAAGRSWATLWEWVASQSGRNGLNSAAAAIASGSVSPHTEHRLAEGQHGLWAMLMDTPGCAALSAGFSPEQVILQGHGRLEPLADPCGSQCDTYNERLAATGVLDALLETAEPVLAEQVAAVSDPQARAMLHRHVRHASPAAQAGLESPEACLAHIRRERPDLFSADAAA